MERESEQCQYETELTWRGDHMTGDRTLAHFTDEGGPRMPGYSGVQFGDKGGEALWGLLLAHQVRVQPGKGRLLKRGR